MKTSDMTCMIKENKGQHEIKKIIDSYRIISDDNPMYIEPNIEPIIGTFSKSTKVVLITAAGATGKTALANKLSYEKKLPILDLASHKAVGEDSFPGLLTSVYGYEKAGHVEESVRNGEYTIIIESIDEGRLRTTEEGLSAFFSSISDVAKRASGISFVLFGRYQILETIWLSLAEAGVDAVLFEIQVFSQEQATNFVNKQVMMDAVVWTKIKPHQEQYHAVRDYIIKKLGLFFTYDDSEKKVAYEKFIGYAPVLIAISELLKRDLNHHKLLEELSKKDYGDKEVELVFDIVKRIMERERVEKIIDKYIPTLTNKMSEADIEIAKRNCYSENEQCIRLVDYLFCGRHEYDVFDNVELQLLYEDGISVWLKDHPFIHDNKFQNIVFEAYCLSKLMNSSEPIFREKALNYLLGSKYKDNQLLYIFFEKINSTRSIYKKFIPSLYASVKSMDSKNIYTEVSIDSTDPDDTDETDKYFPSEVEVFTYYNGKETETTFETIIEFSDVFTFKGYARDLFATLPCTFCLEAKGENLSIGPSVSIRANKINLIGFELSPGDHVLNKPQEELAATVILDCNEFLYTIQSTKQRLNMVISSNNSIGHPFSSYVIAKEKKIRIDQSMEQKYKRFRRIVLTLRSHSKGSLARYSKKIEHKRVLKNETGEKILEAMKKDKILILVDDFYYWNPENASRLVGVTWDQLRKGEINENLITYLSRIR